MPELNCQLLRNCCLCPRACAVDRTEGHTGYCGCDAGFHIASICLHRGEEPPISGTKGICNIFFEGCNMRCLFCQNHQISRAMQSPAQSADEVLAFVIGLLKSGAESVGFVSPSHFAPHVKFIIENLRNQGYFPVTVYNSNGYDSPHVLREMEGLIDIYLPDFKYFDPFISKSLSNAADYPDMVKQALREMYRQKGNTLIINERGIAIQGLIIRHLVLPGYTEDSIRILKWVAEELSPRIHISLMAQYDPNQDVFGHPRLSRMLTKAEYRKVHAAMEDMGFERGWIQEHTSSKHYGPDFREKHPFEKDNNYEIGANE